MTAWVWTALAILANGAVGLSGALIPSRWIVGRASPFLGFAAGAMLAVVFVDLLPDAAAAIGPRAFAWVLGSVAAMALLDWGMRRRAHGDGVQTVVPGALLAADALHNVTDGTAIAAGFLASQQTGLIATLAVVLHELPEEIGDYAILRRAGMPTRTAVGWLAAVQLTAAIGAVATLTASAAYADAAGVALAIAGGTFLYVALAELIPEVLERQADERARSRGMAGFVIGVALVSLLACA